MSDAQVVLQAIEQGFAGVNARLDRLNGKVDGHTAEIALLRAESHRAPCPIVDALQNDVVELQTVNRVRQLTLKRLVGIASAMGAAFATVFEVLTYFLKQ